MGSGQMGTPKCAIFDAIFAMVCVLLAILVHRQGHVCNVGRILKTLTCLTSVDATPLVLPQSSERELPLLNLVEVGELIALLQCKLFA